LSARQANRQGQSLFGRVCGDGSPQIAPAVGGTDGGLLTLA